MKCFQSAAGTETADPPDFHYADSLPANDFGGTDFRIGTRMPDVMMEYAKPALSDINSDKKAQQNGLLYIRTTAHECFQIPSSEGHFYAFIPTNARISSGEDTTPTASDASSSPSAA